MTELTDLENTIKLLQKEVTKLKDIEAIKTVKNKYWRCIDRKLWDDLGGCFAEDIEADYDAVPRKPKGRKALVEFLRQTEGAATYSVSHEGHNAEIELTSETTARGLWTFHDYQIILPDTRRSGWGHYENEFVKQVDEWKIKKIHLIFDCREERFEKLGVAIGEMYERDPRHVRKT